MNYLKKIHDWSKALAEVGISLIALGIVLEVLFKGQGVPFWPQIHVIENVQNKKGINPISSPNQKNLMNKKFFFKEIYGMSDNKGTITKKVLSIKANPIQIPKSKI